MGHPFIVDKNNKGEPPEQLAAPVKMLRVNHNGKFYDVEMRLETDEEMACRAVVVACCDGQSRVTLERVALFRVSKSVEEVRA